MHPIDAMLVLLALVFALPAAMIAALVALDMAWPTPDHRPPMMGRNGYVKIEEIPWIDADDFEAVEVYGVRAAEVDTC